MPVKYTTAVCLLLHATLVAGHIVILCLWAKDIEHSLIVSLSDASRVGQYISLLSQGFIPYAALLLYLTHSLAARKVLNERYVTLTAAHDNANAWNGIVSALTGLWQQISLASSPLVVTQIAVYLGSLSILPITTPAIFNMQNFDYMNTPIPTTVGMPVLNTLNISTQDDAAADPWVTAAQLLPRLLVADGISTVGLSGDTIYDILDTSNTVGEVAVNATTANVTCGTVPNASVISLEYDPGDGYSYTTIGATYDGYNLTWSSQNIDALSFNQGRNTTEAIVSYTSYEASAASIPLGRNAAFLITTNVIDSTGKSGSAVRGNFSYKATQMIGCTLSWVARSGTVDAVTRNLTSLETVGRLRSPTWSEWRPIMWNDTASDEYSLNSDYPSTDNQVDAWSHMLYASSQTQASLRNGSVMMSASEQYLLMRLGGPGMQLNSTITLADVEVALSEMTAATYWAVAHALDASQQHSDLTINKSQTLGAQLYSRLNINVVAVAVGLAASTVLLLSSAVLICTIGGENRKRTRVVKKLDTLHATWLVGHNPDVLTRVSEVEKPTLKRLRVAGTMGLDMRLERVTKYIRSSEQDE
ncbi:hypothetical protein DAEQUDRAFT_765628 [Daedalea quercina L-15889]|uniref:Uncharacterized protein n=1 Tax=Daedalea quercina L-15889 TaxID=1314783 RepID=A0A165QDX2_9APHY|nr:hypothetical protein DAEQUDRAFT_765628 [Daedalea quercina L-15889]